jgi:hypothetical protein
MSRKGDCRDNAVTETLFGSLKVERLHGMHSATRHQGEGRRARLASVLQSSEASLDTGISQPDGLREKSGLPIKEDSPHNRSAKGDAKRRQVQPILPEKSNLMQASSGFPQRVPICLSQRRRITTGLLFNMRFKMERQGWNVPIDREGFSKSELSRKLPSPIMEGKIMKLWEYTGEELR